MSRKSVLPLAGTAWCRANHSPGRLPPVMPMSSTRCWCSAPSGIVCDNAQEIFDAGLTRAAGLATTETPHAQSERYGVAAQRQNGYGVYAVAMQSLRGLLTGGAGGGVSLWRDDQH